MFIVAAEFQIREATEEDLEHLARISSAIPFLPGRFLVARGSSGIAAFLAWRQIVPGEREILQFETMPAFRRQGLARRLLREFKVQELATLFLEVRKSNLAALHLYGQEGFEQIGLRGEYYSSPQEDAIVLRFRPC